MTCRAVNIQAGDVCRLHDKLVIVHSVTDQWATVVGLEGDPRVHMTSQNTSHQVRINKLKRVRVKM